MWWLHQYVCKQKRLQRLSETVPAINWIPFRTSQGHCGACRRKWRLTDTDLCPCGETQTMSHMVESCPLTKLNDGLSRLHSADEDAVSWLTNYGKWHAYEKKKILVFQNLCFVFYVDPLGYQEALAKFTLKKFLLLVLFLDKAKTAHLIGYNPCLFCKDSDYKVCNQLY